MSGVVVALAGYTDEAATEMAKFIRVALFIRNGDGANVVVKLAVDKQHRKHLLGYCTKDHGQPHYKLWYGGFEETEITTARKEYQS